MSDHAAALEAHLTPGNRAMLAVMGRRFLVSLLSADADRIRVSFPVVDFPAEGMRVDLEFHDPHGFAHCETEVLEAGGGPGEGLVLRRPAASMWNQHRATWRVPVDLPVSYKGHVHPRRVEARLANLSTGGALLESPNPVAQGDSLDIALTLPDSEPLSLLGQVVHAAPDPEKPGTHQVGVRFVSPDAVDRKTINQYLWRRLRALYGPVGSTTT